MWLKFVSVGSLLFIIGCQNEAHFVPDMAADLSTSDEGPSEGSDLSLPLRPATDHPPLPLLNNQRGPIIPNMKAYLVIWPGDIDIGEQAQQFMQWMLQSDYWTGTLGEYGVKQGTFEQLITLSDPPPSSLDDTMIQSTLAKLVMDGEVAVDSSTVVFFVTPAGTQVSFRGTFGCSDFGGYHWQTDVNQSPVSYAVAVQCANDGIDPLNALTPILSHEASEAATDPRPASSPSWRSLDTGLEISDLCELFNARVTAMVQGGDGGVPTGDGGVLDVTYRVTRNYSNKAALLGDEDPCKPVTSTVPYYGVALDPLVVEIGRDESNEGEFTAHIEPYAFGNVGPISWQIIPLGGGITIAPDHGTNNAGETVGVVIKVDSSTPIGAQQIYVIGHAAAGGHSSWSGAVLY
jgi:hypothetical protein